MPDLFEIFHYRDNILAHVKKSKVCLHNLIYRGPILSIRDAEALDDANKAKNRRLYRAGKKNVYKTIPTCQAFGPFVHLDVQPQFSSSHHPLGRGQSYAVIIPGGVDTPALDD